jgi:hypothetical protein
MAIQNHRNKNIIHISDPFMFFLFVYQQLVTSPTIVDLGFQICLVQIGSVWFGLISAFLLHPTPACARWNYPADGGGEATQPLRIFRFNFRQQTSTNINKCK